MCYIKTFNVFFALLIFVPKHYPRMLLLMKNKFKIAFGFLFASILFIGLINKFNNADVIVENKEVDKPQYEYGILTDTFLVKKNSIKKNESLSNILLRHHIPWPKINSIAKKSKKVFDVRRIKSGKNYTVLCTKDSIQKARYLVYETSAKDYIVFDLTKEIKIYKGEKPVKKKVMAASGVINSSLYATLQKHNVNPSLAISLSEVFAWQVDFYRIQKGDKFKVIYEEEYVDDKSIGIGRIKAAYFKHANKDYYGIYFEQNKRGEYFDEEAQSLRKAFLKAPLKYNRISSRYSKKRFHPVQKRYKAHLGTDYAAPTGTPIRAVGDGKVTRAQYQKYNGKYVKIRHNSVYTTQYLHMSKIAKGIKAGTWVKQGQVIGYVGSTGLATGPHLCYRFWKNGKQVDALKVKIPSSNPVKKANLAVYTKIKDKMLKKLDEIDYDKPKIFIAKI